MPFSALAMNRGLTLASDLVIGKNPRKRQMVLAPVWQQHWTLPQAFGQ